MCGIVGALAFNSTRFEITEPYITKMRDKMEHRGPDGAGTWVSDDHRVGFGHRRLSIIDLSDLASQPMRNDDGQVVLTFNGEIYNHAEIREELKSIRSFQWKTDHSDTEVVLRAYETWGIDCIQKFRGMFAFGIWDNRTREMYLVRDRIGVKPLYYSLYKGRITFASEIKAMLEDPDLPRKMHEPSLSHFMSFLTTPAPQTLFDGVKKIPSGCYVHVTLNGEARERRYWDVWDHTEPMIDKTDDQIAERVLEELSEAVDLRKVGDVPIGIFLSGGIDSSTNAALFSEGETSPVKTFSIGYDADYGTYKNELHFAKQMAEEVGADYYERRLNIDDLIDFLPKMIELQDEPIADPVCVPVYYLSKLARDNGVTVCQVGEGADELFWGYESWKTYLKLAQLNDLPVPGFIKKSGLSVMKMLGQGHRPEWELLRRGAHGYPVFWGGAFTFSEQDKRRLFSSRFNEVLGGTSSWDAIRPIYDRYQAGAWEKSHLNWMSYLDLNYRLPELLLMRVDKMSMGVSLEGRVPFLDHKFVEMAMSIPSSVKTRDWVNKYILKKAVRGTIPDNLIDRRKQGFAVPVYDWFLGRLGPMVKKELDWFTDATGYFDKSEVDRLFAQARGPKIWHLYNFVLWYKRFIA